MKKNWTVICILLGLLTFAVILNVVMYYWIPSTSEIRFFIGVLTVFLGFLTGMMFGFEIFLSKGVWHLYNLKPGSLQILAVIETGEDVTQVKLSLQSVKGSPVFLVDIDNYYFIGSGELPQSGHRYVWNGKKLTFIVPSETILRTREA